MTQIPFENQIDYSTSVSIQPWKKEKTIIRYESSQCGKKTSDLSNSSLNVVLLYYEKFWCVEIHYSSPWNIQRIKTNILYPYAHLCPTKVIMLVYNAFHDLAWG